MRPFDPQRPILTAPLGASAAHALPAALLKRLFAIYLMVVSLLMFRDALRL